MNTNYARISRTDDEPYDAEGEWVAERRGEIFAQWRKDQTKMREYVTDAMFDDENEDMFPHALADFFLPITGNSPDTVLVDAAIDLFNALRGAIYYRMHQDAETQAQHEWDNRQTGPEDA